MSYMFWKLWMTLRHLVLSSFCLCFYDFGQSVSLKNLRPGIVSFSLVCCLAYRGQLPLVSFFFFCCFVVSSWSQELTRCHRCFLSCPFVVTNHVATLAGFLSNYCVAACFCVCLQILSHSICLNIYIFFFHQACIRVRILLPFS